MLKKKNLNLPEKFEELVKKYHEIPDWESKYKSLLEENNKLQQKQETLAEEGNDSQTQRKLNNVLKVLHCVVESKYGKISGNEKSVSNKVHGVAGVVGKTIIEGYLKDGSDLMQDEI